MMVDWPSVHSVLTTHTPSCRLWPLEQLLQFPRLGPTQVRQLASHLKEESMETEHMRILTHVLNPLPTQKTKNTCREIKLHPYRHTTQCETEHTHTEANHQNKACHQQINKPPTPEHTPVSSPPTYPVPVSYLWVWLCGIEASAAGGHTPPLLHQVAFCTMVARFNTCTWCRNEAETNMFLNS